MQVQVSLIVDISARATVTEMKQQIQQAGRESMRQAMKGGPTEIPREIPVRARKRQSDPSFFRYRWKS